MSQAILKHSLLANTYDSVWSVALAIDASLRQNVTLNFTKPDVSNFSSLLESKKLLYQLKLVRFVGVSGHVAFQNDGTPRYTYGLSTACSYISICLSIELCSDRFDVFNIVKILFELHKLRVHSSLPMELTTFHFYFLLFTFTCVSKLRKFCITVKEPTQSLVSYTY